MIDIKLHKTLLSSSNSFELDVSIKIETGQLISIYGKSGSGKTTMLRLISGLDFDQEGLIKINNSIWFDSEKRVNLTPQKRKVGMVFQDSALFPNMTVKENLEFAMEKGQPKSIITELIETIELNDLQHRKPNTLSGGQKQLVALARALVQKPDILLLDEPFSALDDEMRVKLQDYILRLHKKYKLTTFLVSHDLAEVFKLSDSVLKLDKGKITQQGTPENVFISHSISDKYKKVGTILSIYKADIVNIVNIISGKNIIKLISTDDEITGLSVGDKVIIASKTFNPILIKI